MSVISFDKTRNGTLVRVHELQVHVVSAETETKVEHVTTEGFEF